MNSDHDHILQSTINQAQVIGNLIRITRKEKRITTSEAANLANISRGLLQRIEKGDLKCNIGSVLEVAKVLDVNLFNHELSSLPLSTQLKYTKLMEAALPKSIRSKQPE